MAAKNLQSGGLNVAIVGGGVAGITAAFLCQQKHRVTIFEKNNYLGGHTNTVVVNEGEDTDIPVDTGFIVLNDKTYPLFHRLLRLLDVPVRYSDMSFSFYSEIENFYYAGTSLNGLFAKRQHLVSPRFYRFLFEIRRFSKLALKALAEDQLKEKTMNEFNLEHKISADLERFFVIPMAAAIWSTPANQILNYPAKSFLRFFHNHGLLSLKDRPRWQTVVGGSHAYIKAFKRVFNGTIHLNTAVNGAVRKDGKVQLELSDSPTQHFDAVIFATHADQTLKILRDPCDIEQRALGAWQYQLNHTVLHHDTRLLPPKKSGWASWNYFEFDAGSSQNELVLTYDMNRLQGLQAKRRYCVSLNASGRIDPAKIVREINYYHPVYNVAAWRSQDTLKKLNGKRSSWFCGSYFGFGFHEDAVRSAVAVGERFGGVL